MRLLLAVVTSMTIPAGSGESDSAASPCIRYGIDTVQLAGRLSRETFPGPPNYESVRRGDTPETGFYLTLTAPVCTMEDSTRDLDSITKLQLVLDSAGYARLRPSLGRTATVRGTLFGAATGHHHTPALVQVIWQ